VGLPSELVQVLVQRLDLRNVLLLQVVQLALYIDFTDQLVVCQFQKSVFTAQIVELVFPVLDLVKVLPLYLFQVFSG